MRSFGLIGLLLVLGVGYYVFNRSGAGGPGQGAPLEQIDTTAIRQRLLAIGQTERQYAATHGAYASLEQLTADDLLPGGTEQRGYTFTATTSGAEHFTITATPTDPGTAGCPTLEITENMQVRER